METTVMLKRTAIVTSLVYFALGAPAVLADDKWAIDSAHSDAHFSVKHMMISNVQGDFGNISGTANFDGEHFNKASVEANIPIADINTREPKRDSHLKSPEFLDVDKYPTMTFKSKQI